MSNNEDQNKETKGLDAATFFFWLLWILGLVLFPFYGFTFLFETGVVKEGNLGSQISPFIGAGVFIAQIVVMVKSFQQKKQNLPLSKSYLTLLGGSIVIGLIWAGGCSIMGPWNLH